MSSTTVTVANAAARYALTDSDVQIGWTVIQSDNSSEWSVVDLTQLSTDDGYLLFASLPGISDPGTPTAGFNEVTPEFGTATPSQARSIDVQVQLPGKDIQPLQSIDTSFVPPTGFATAGVTVSKQSEGAIAPPTRGQIWPRGSGKA